MDDNVEFMESDGPVAQVQPKILSSASVQDFDSKQLMEETQMSTEDKNCNLTIMLTSKKISSEEEEMRSPTSQVSSHLKEKLNLKSGSGVNGMVNGLTVGMDLSHTADFEYNSLSNGKTDFSSHCDKCEKALFSCDNSSTTDSKVVSNRVNSNSDSLCRSSESSKSIDEVGPNESSESGDIRYVSYKSELQMPDIMRLIQKDLSEPYSIYTYRYFIHNWPKLCFLAMHENECVGAIVCKLDVHRKVVKRGYIAMLAVDEKYRKRKIGSNLVLKAIRAMVEDDADEVVLETEITNRPALRLYENLGFVRDKRLFRYYLNGVDALRLKLWLR
ncbi:N-alpha-acetyltransferase 30 [Anabrus simplex]|uniref:N-alpha-acetyltransferase 30 n=1 Tax=Anabrus simplex TaxID=316456 RepID=UPI0034DDB9DE